MPPRISIMGVPIDSVTERQAIDHILDSIDAGKGGWVITPNLDILRKLVVEREFAALCEGSTLRLADGMPLIWAAKLRGTPLPERVAGSDLIWSLTEGAANKGRTVFLLGGNPGAADAAAQVFRSRYPSIRIAGTECPGMGFEKDATYMMRLEARLKELKPDIVYVALGAPKQERLIALLRPVLPAAWFLGIGISFSFVSGEVKRAPNWMRRIGLEWFHRMLQEPKRLGKRYLVDGLPFAARLFATSWREAHRSGSRTDVTRSSDG